MENAEIWKCVLHIVDVKSSMICRCKNIPFLFPCVIKSGLMLIGLANQLSQSVVFRRLYLQVKVLLLSKSPKQNLEYREQMVWDMSVRIISRSPLHHHFHALGSWPSENNNTGESICCIPARCFSSWHGNWLPRDHSSVLLSYLLLVLDA